MALSSRVRMLPYWIVRDGSRRLRWDLKLRILRRYDVRIGAQPITALRYLLLDSELDNFTYRISNTAELASLLASALALPAADLERWVAEPDQDRRLQKDLRDILRYRPAHKRRLRFGRRLGWYATVRALQPRLVVETGVHDGMGSALLLRALERNAEELGVEGRLISFDISPHVGWLVGDRLARRWDLVIGATTDMLRPTLEGESIDVFIHDSDHSYACERFEFDTAMRFASAGAALITDNAHATSALRDVARDHGLQHHLFMERPVRHFYPGAGMGLVRLDG